MKNSPAAGFIPPSYIAKRIYESNVLTPPEREDGASLEQLHHLIIIALRSTDAVLRSAVP